MLPQLVIGAGESVMECLLGMLTRARLLMAAPAWLSAAAGGVASLGTGMPHASSASHRTYGATNRSPAILL